MPSRARLGNSYKAAGCNAKAIWLHWKTMAAPGSGVLGPGHPSTLNSRIRLEEARRAGGGDQGAEEGGA